MNTYIITLANGQLEEWNHVNLKFVGSWVIVEDENGEDQFAYSAHKVSHIVREDAA